MTFTETIIIYWRDRKIWKVRSGPGGHDPIRKQEWEKFKKLIDEYYQEDDNV